MKKKYIRPTLDVVASQLNEQLMKHSYDWADAKGDPNGVWDDDQNGEDGQIQSRNLWDD